MSSNGWKKGKLSDIAEITMGQSPKGEFCNNEGNGEPLLNGPTEFGANHPHPTQFTTDIKKSAKPGALLFCVRGSTVGKMNWANRKYAIGRGIAAISPKDNNSNHFLKAVIETKLPELLKYATGSTFPNISKSMLTDMDIEIPTSKEILVINSILASINSKIEVNNKISQRLEEMAQALFKHWFVDFEFPNEDGEPYKSSGGEMIESELGMIPKGWEVVQLGEISDIFGGGTPKTAISEYWDGNIPWITPKDLSGYNRKFIKKGGRSITKEGLEKSSAKLIPKNSILFSSRAPIGYITIATNEVSTNQGFKSVNANCNKITNSYIYQTLLNNVELIKSQANGSTFKEVSASFMKQYKLLLPDINTMNLFSDIILKNDKMLQKNYNEVDILKQTRDTLLPKLMSGELRVTDIQD